MTQVFRVAIAGETVTSSVESCSTSYALGNIINTASITMTVDPTLYLGKAVVIVQGDNTFNGIVRSYQKTTNLKYQVECASLGGKLSDPYFVNAEGIANATNSSELCSEYSAKSGVPITYNAVEIDFGGSWVESSTPATELLKMAAVIGADIKDNGSGIIIENVKAVSGDGIALDKNDILEVRKVSDTIMDNGLGFVTTRTSNARDEAGDGGMGNVVARNRIAADVDTKTGKVKIYNSPNRDLDTWNGINFIGEGEEYLTYSTGMAGDASIEVDGVLLYVKKVTVDGVTVTNYKYKTGTSLLYFTTPVFGNVAIEYRTYYREFSLKTTLTPEGKRYIFNCTMLNEYLDDTGLLDKDAESSFISDDAGQWGYYVPDGTDYIKGFVFYTYGNPTVDLYDGATKISTVGKITSVGGVYTRFTRASLTKNDEDLFSFTLDIATAHVIDVTSGGVSIAFNQDDATVSFTSYHPDVEVEYTYTGIRYDVKYAFDPDTQTIVLNSGTEIKLDGGDGKWWDPDEFPCGYPANFPFKIDEILKLPLEDVVGRTIGGMNAPINSKGFCFATITQDGIYEYDTAVLKKDSSITLRANSNGSL